MPLSSCANNHSTFANKLRALRPSLKDELKPGAFMIAIPHHDKDPANNFIMQDVVWIKCPADKDITTLTTVYGKQRKGTGLVAFLHDGRILDPKTKISSLARDGSDALMALRASPVAELQKKLVPSDATRSPLGEITNTPRKSPPSSFEEPLKLENAATARADSPAPARPVFRAPSSVTLPPPQSSLSPDPASADPERDALQSGWEDFLAERHCHQRSIDLRFNRDESFINLNERDAGIVSEWKGLTKGQRLYFIERSRRTAFKLNSHFTTRVQRWSFWSFYYELYFQRNAEVQDPHITLEGAKEYLDSAIQRWESQSDAARSRNYDSHYIICLRAELRGALVMPELQATEQPVTSRAARVSEALSTPPEKQNIKHEDNSEEEDSDESEDSLPLSDEAANAPGNVAPQPSSQPDSLPRHLDTIQEADFHLDIEDSTESQAQAPTRLTMSELFDGRTPEQLEKSVKCGVELLADIEKTLKSQPSQDSDQWLKAIENVQKQAVRSRTIVGVVGATGAGKSSVINAMLDEERLVPTNCMRACTAVVTETIYNYDSDGYKAEVEFISPTQWQKQLEILFQELFDGSGKVSRDCANKASEAGVAYAQIKAMYPRSSRGNVETVPNDNLVAYNILPCLR